MIKVIALHGRRVAEGGHQSNWRCQLITKLPLIPWSKGNLFVRDDLACCDCRRE